MSSAEGQRLAATLLNGGGGGPMNRTADATEAILEVQKAGNAIGERTELLLDVPTYELAAGVA